jgi:hypothetical protein
MYNIKFTFLYLKSNKPPLYIVCSFSPIDVLWLVVLTVPAGQVAEETIIEDEEEEEEKLPLVKRPRMAEMTNRVEEMKVMNAYQ